MFYILFHLWLNILAELTHFGDREFYKVGPLRTCCTPCRRWGTRRAILAGLAFGWWCFPSMRFGDTLWLDKCLPVLPCTWARTAILVVLAPLLWASPVFAFFTTQWQL